MNERSVKAYMDANGMLPGGGKAKVLVACSGGADSVALLHLLRGMDGVDVVCAHFNHCLRGAESDRDEAFVRGLCAEWDVAFYAGRGDVAGFAGKARRGTEEAARALRYRFLRETAKKTGCARVATAHTADDNAETVLLNLVRGAGTRGLAGIPPVRGSEAAGVKIIRPLLDATRTEIEEYLLENGLSHVEDSSNEGDAYARNRLRHHVTPLLRDLNGAAVEHICAAAALLREDEEYLDGLAVEWIGEHYRDGALPLRPLLELPKPVAMRVLRRLTQSPGRAHLERIWNLCANGREHAALDLPAGRVTKENGFLRFGPAAAETTIPRREIAVGGTTALPEAGVVIRCSETDYTKEIHKSFNTFYFQCEKICGKISVASREAGDAIRLRGRGCTKSVRRLFSEAGLPLAARARTPVFSDEAGVIAVGGFGVAERCAPEPGKKAIKIEIL